MCCISFKIYFSLFLFCLLRIVFLKITVEISKRMDYTCYSLQEFLVLLLCPMEQLYTLDSGKLPHLETSYSWYINMLNNMKPKFWNEVMFPKGSNQNFIIFCLLWCLMKLMDFCRLGKYVAEVYWTFMFL